MKLAKTITYTIFRVPHPRDELQIQLRRGGEILFSDSFLVSLPPEAEDPYQVTVAVRVGGEK